MENANGQIRQWLPRRIDLDEISEADIQKIVMTIKLSMRKCLDYRYPVSASLSELGRDVEIRFSLTVAARTEIGPRSKSG